MNWKHKDLLEISQLNREEIEHVFQTAARFAEVNQRSEEHTSEPPVTSVSRMPSSA